MRQNLPTQRDLAFVIHDLNTWGGQDRSTLEIAKRLSHYYQVKLYAFSLDPRPEKNTLKKMGWGQVEFIQISPNVKSPVLAKTLYFYGATLLPLLAQNKFFKKNPSIIHSTGACSLISNVVHVQFIHTAWKKIAKKLGDALVFPKSAKELYRKLVLDMDVFFERQVFTNKKHYIAISNSVAKDLIRNFKISKKQIQVIHHGVDTEIFCPSTDGKKELRNELKIKSSDIMAVFVGTYERKGLGSAIKSMSYLSANAKKNIKLVAVGSGNVNHFKDLAKRHGVEEQLIFVQHKKNILPYYQAADLFILPTTYEPFGLVILEAMSCGLACIVSECAGAAELMTDGKSGLLIRDPLNAQEISTKLEELVLNKSFRKEIGKNAREVALNHSWDRVAKEYLDFLNPLFEAMKPNAE